MGGSYQWRIEGGGSGLCLCHLAHGQGKLLEQSPKGI